MLQATHFFNQRTLTAEQREICTNVHGFTMLELFAKPANIIILRRPVSTYAAKAHVQIDHLHRCRAIIVII